MELALIQQIACPFMTHVGLGNDIGGYLCDIGFVLFFLLFLWIGFCFSTKVCFTVRRFHCLKKAICFWQLLDKREQTACFFNLNRLLQFTRAVVYSISTGSCRMVGVEKKSCMSDNGRFSGIMRCEIIT